jgi:hypothetical protein
MPDLARGHFDRNLLPPRSFTNVCLFDDDWNLELAPDASDQPLVRVTAPASQTMIQVGDSQPPPVRSRKTMQQIEQDHGIDAAGHSHENVLPWRQEPPCSDVLTNMREEINHTRMLPAPHRMCQSREAYGLKACPPHVRSLAKAAHMKLKTELDL